MRVVIKGFGPFQRDYVLKLKPGINVIRGANAAGKTTIIKALKLALYKLNPQEMLEVSTLINDNAKTCYIEVDTLERKAILEASKDKISKNEFIIDSIEAKEFCFLTADSELLAEVIGQRRINKLLKSYSQKIELVHLLKVMNLIEESLSKTRDRVKREIMELEIIKNRLREIEKEISNLEKEKKELEEKKRKAEKEYEEKLSEIAKKIGEDYENLAEKIKELRKEIDAKEENLNRKEIELEKLRKEIRELSKKIGQITIDIKAKESIKMGREENLRILYEKLNSLDQEISKAKEKYDQLSSEQNELLRKLSIIESADSLYLAHLLAHQTCPIYDPVLVKKCPYVKELQEEFKEIQEFMKKKQELISKQLKEISNVIQEIETKIREREKVRVEIEEEEEEIRKIEEEIKNLKKESAEMERELEAKKEDEEKLNSEIKRLFNELKALKTKYIELEKKFSEVSPEIERIRKNLNKHKKKLEQILTQIQGKEKEKNNILSQMIKEKQTIQRSILELIILDALKKYLKNLEKTEEEKLVKWFNNFVNKLIQDLRYRYIESIELEYDRLSNEIIMRVKRPNVAEPADFRTLSEAERVTIAIALIYTLLRNKLQNNWIVFAIDAYTELLDDERLQALLRALGEDARSLSKYLVITKLDPNFAEPTVSYEL